jgi:hypothetical protein
MCIAVGEMGGRQVAEGGSSIYAEFANAFRFATSVLPRRMDDNVTTPVSIATTTEELRATVEHLRQQNADLRASALLWKRLYEQALAGDTPVELECARGSDAELLHPKLRTMCSTLDHCGSAHRTDTGEFERPDTA